MPMSQNINRRNWLEAKVSKMSLEWLLIGTRLTDAKKWQVCYAKHDLLLLFGMYPVEEMASNQVDRD